MADTSSVDQEAPFVRLDGSDWELWPEVVVRSAGFPAASALALSAPELADAAARSGAGCDPAFRQAYHRAQADLSAALRQFAADPRFREAIAWQNRAVLATCVDKVRDGAVRAGQGAA
jgi:hypothetical protein